MVVRLRTLQLYGQHRTTNSICIGLPGEGQSAWVHTGVVAAARMQRMDRAHRQKSDARQQLRAPPSDAHAPPCSRIPRREYHSRSQHIEWDTMRGSRRLETLLYAS